MVLLAATFASPTGAALARRSLVEAGIAPEDVVLSTSLTSDDIAAEAPGQSFENQGYRSSDQIEVSPGWTDQDRARYNEALRAAGCVLSVRLESAKRQEAVSAILRESGAKSTEAPNQP